MSERMATIRTFLERAGWGDAACRKLAGDASFRTYYRVAGGGRRAVLMDAPPPKEDVRPFVAVANCLAGLGLSAPRIIVQDVDAGLLLLEDLGDDTYTRRLAAGADERTLYALAVDTLIELHRRFDAGGAPDLRRFGEAQALREVGLLLEWYWPVVMGGPASAKLRESYAEAWRAALPSMRGVADSLALFDFHVDNLMWLGGRPAAAACGLLDFQDAVIAPVAFDLVSLLEDARRDVPAGLVAEMQRRYRAAFPLLDAAAFATAYSVIGAQRNTRIIAVFTRLMVRDGKPQYLANIPRLWRLLAGDLAHPALAPVREWFDRHLPRERRLAPAAVRA